MQTEYECGIEALLLVGEIDFGYSSLSSLRDYEGASSSIFAERAFGRGGNGLYVVEGVGEEFFWPAVNGRAERWLVPELMHRFANLSPLNPFCLAFEVLRLR